MRKYRVRVNIDTFDKGPHETAEVVLGVMAAKDIHCLVKEAELLLDGFVKASKEETPVEQHERLVAAQNKEE